MMLPILWRYLLTQFIKVFLFCTLTFVAVLLTTRLDEIAHFATLGPEGKLIFWYTLYQLPYILPIAIPISCLIASILLMQRLSGSHELTALRASGLSFSKIFVPILFAALMICVLNFIVISELATQSHLSTNILKTELRSVNPLLLLQSKHIMRAKGYYFDTLGHSKLGEVATHVVLASPAKDNHRMHLLLADKLVTTPEKFHGENVTILSSLGEEKSEGFDRLIVENMKEGMTSITDFTQIADQKMLKLNNDHLRLPLLLMRLRDEKSKLAQLKANGKPSSEQKVVVRTITRCYTEMMRRLSVALAPLTFTLMGGAFGISIGRRPSVHEILYVAALSAFYLICFFAAKGSDHHMVAASVLYYAPHVIIIILSVVMLNRLAKGIE